LVKTISQQAVGELLPAGTRISGQVKHFFNSPHLGNSMYFNEKSTGSAVGVILYFIRIELK